MLLLFVSFPCPDTIRLLLLCGANVNVYDNDKNSPLHVLADTVIDVNVFGITKYDNNNYEQMNSQSTTTQSIEIVEEITRIFIQAGIHLDAVNNYCVTAANSCACKWLFNLLLYINN